MPKSKKGSAVDQSNSSFTGNIIGEWLGHRIFPSVRLDVNAFLGAGFGKCPFLTQALGKNTVCIKNENSLGVCTVSTSSGATSQDWLACPYRVISSELVRDACQKIFGVSLEGMSLSPATRLDTEDERSAFKEAVHKRGTGYIYFQNKLGGEISITSTKSSPEMSFDVSIAEIVAKDNSLTVARYGILEIQTMDFHGSYRAAVTNLRDALRLHKASFPDALKDNIVWASEGIEGPNIANVFKRTFYQMLLKFQLSCEGAAAGTILAIPEAVWDSWQPFLGAPEFEQKKDGAYYLKTRESDSATFTPTNAYICVFALDSSHPGAISPLKVNRYIRVNAEQLAHHAFTVVPEGMIKSLSETDSILQRIREKVAKLLPVVT